MVLLQPPVVKFNCARWRLYFAGIKGEGFNLLIDVHVLVLMIRLELQTMTDADQQGQEELLALSVVKDK